MQYTDPSQFSPVDPSLPKSLYSFVIDIIVVRLPCKLVTYLQIIRYSMPLVFLLTLYCSSRVALSRCGMCTYLELAWLLLYNKKEMY